MKIKVQLKDPDVMHDAVSEAVAKEVNAMNLPKDEQRLLVEARTEKIINAMSKWWEYGEYLTAEFDMDSMTASVVERE